MSWWQRERVTLAFLALVIVSFGSAGAYIEYRYPAAPCASPSTLGGTAHGA